MAVSTSAVSSARQMYAGTLGTSSTTLYTAPAASGNVTSPSATAYIKEIIIANISSSSATVNLVVGGISIMLGLSVAANDTKVLSGLNTMIPAGATITGLASAASTINVIISGVEVQ